MLGGDGDACELRLVNFLGLFLVLLCGEGI